MLKLILNPTFSADVEITVPGQQETGTVSLTFKYLGRKEYRAMVDSFSEVKDAKGKITKEVTSMEEAFPQFVTGWGFAEPFTTENIDLFLNNYPAAYMDIFTQYSKLLMASRIKN